MTERLRTIIAMYAAIVATLAWGSVLCGKINTAMDYRTVCYLTSATPENPVTHEICYKEKRP